MPRSNATGYWDVSDLGSTPLYTAALPGEEVVATAREREILVGLAQDIARLSRRPREKELRNLWRRHNDLKPTRPLVVCDPENGWNEIIPETQLECTSRLTKHWEMALRKDVYWGEHVQDDRPIEPVFRIGYTCADSGFGVEERYVHTEKGGSYTWVPAISHRRDLEKLHFQCLEVDRETTERAVVLARDIFGDLLDVRTAGAWWWSLGMTTDLVVLRGMEQVMIDMIDEPHFVHDLMEFLTENTLSKLHFLEVNGLLTPNTDSYLPPGGFGYTDELPEEDFSRRVHTEDMWGFGESQESVGVSPKMFAEFIFPYQLRVLRKFGLVSYGCCEPLERRWEIIRQIPRLRKVSVSCFADLELMASQLKDEFCFCMKPHPADLAVPVLDRDMVRRKLRRAFETTRSCRVEVLMQDTHTIGGNPENVVNWVRIAMEESRRLE
jgi:hypothetical protein